MTALLTEFLSEGLIEKLDGDDSRFEKLEKAAEARSTSVPSNTASGLCRGYDHSHDSHAGPLDH